MNETISELHTVSCVKYPTVIKILNDGVMYSIHLEPNAKVKRFLKYGLLPDSKGRLVVYHSDGPSGEWSELCRVSPGENQGD